MDRSAIELVGGAGGTPASTSDFKPTRTPLHLAVIGGLDPAAEETWSGTPKAMIEALRELGHRVSPIGPLPKVEAGWARLLGTWHSRASGKTYLAIRDPAALRRRVAPLDAALRAAEPYDAVIAWHAADAAIVRTTAPLIFVHDATWRRLLDFYPRYERKRLTLSSIAGGEAIDRAALQSCARAIYSSSWAADAARDDYGTPAAKLAVHPFGPNLPLIPTREALRRVIAERGRGPCRLLFVGVSWQRKGGDIAIDVARRLNASGTACRLDVVGAERPADRPRWVRAHGLLPRSDPLAAARLTALFTRADFLILPTHADCTPIVLSEAAACGLPVATTAVGGIAETVGDAGWAKAFPAGTAAEPFADWIARSYHDRARYQDMAWRARREYEERLNWTSFARAVIAAIGELPDTAGIREAAAHPA